MEQDAEEIRSCLGHIELMRHLHGRIHSCAYDASHCAMSERGGLSRRVEDI
jgi:hypothetical protein